MATYHGKPAAKINEIMKSYLPETKGCSFADFPMNHPRWLEGNEKTRKGEPCFIKTGNELPESGIKVGYVWGAGRFGFGYYHLMTKSASVILYNRINSNKVQTGVDEGCCCFGTPDPRSKMPDIDSDDRDDMRRLFYARSVSPVPNDGEAKNAAIAEATATAQAHYMYDQNIQMAHYTANAVAAVAPIKRG